jgi:LPXTG-motif cell wall-anchored protein
MRIRRIGATLVAIGLGAAGLIAVATAAPSAAASTGISVLCKQNPNITSDISATFDVSFDAPSEVETGAPIALSNIFVPFSNTQGLTLTFGPWTANASASGGASPSSFSMVASAVTMANGASVDIGSFSKTLTAPASPGSVAITIDSVVFPVSLDGGVTTLTTVTCTPTGANTLTTISVVSPPPPGAPDAVADGAEVKPGDSVDIDVLDNDVPADAGSIGAPEIMDAPSEGTAEVNDDGSITYTANADTTATSDSFEYRVCTEFEEVEVARGFGKSFRRGEQRPCDSTTVTINIIQPQATTTTPPTDPPTTGPAGSVSPTTDELPATGSSSTPLGVLGFAVALLGLGLLAASRRSLSADRTA